MILSDRSIREALADGRIEIDPVDDSFIQPSSVDLTVDRFFRVFRNHTTPIIDVKQNLEDLTELVEIPDDGVFVLHPGEFVLGATAERIRLPNDLVARLEGKSSLGRLGLLIHSSLPASEPVMFLDERGLRPVPIGDIVTKQLTGQVVSFDPGTFEVGYHDVTGWYQGPPDRIYEIELASGRQVRVTAGHNLFTIDRDGELAKVRTGELRAGQRVAVPGLIPDPAPGAPHLSLLGLVPESARATLTCTGPTVAAAFSERPDEVASLLRAAGYPHVGYYRNRDRLPLSLAYQVPRLVESLDGDDRIGVRGGRSQLPPTIDVDHDLAWLLGLYVAEGSRRATQLTISNTDQAILDRVERVLAGLDLPVYRVAGSITCTSALASRLMGWLDRGDGAAAKRVPPVAYSWPSPLVESFLEGFIDGDGSREANRTSLWTCSNDLVSDFLVLLARLGKRAGASWRDKAVSGLWQISVPCREHKLLTGVPLPDRLLVELRESCGLDQLSMSRLAGYRHPTSLNNIERRRARDAVRLPTLRRLAEALASRPDPPGDLGRLTRLTEGDLSWDVVSDVRDTGATEPIYDLEVRPSGRKVENFLAGAGGVFVSNTAGFIDAGFDGHLTLELSNVATLPITLYPGMKIGQISFLEMTTEADAPYGSKTIGSKYQGQRGPTDSRYWENFDRPEV